MSKEYVDHIRTDTHTALIWPGLVHVHRTEAAPDGPVAILAVEDPRLDTEQGHALAAKAIEADLARMPALTPWKRITAAQADAEIASWGARP